MLARTDEIRGFKFRRISWQQKCLNWAFFQYYIYLRWRLSSRVEAHLARCKTFAGRPHLIKKLPGSEVVPEKEDLGPVHSYLFLLIGLPATRIWKRSPTVSVRLSWLNPLSPNSDQHQFSPNKIHRLSRAKSMRINKMITKGKNLWSVSIKFSQLMFEGNVWRSVWRICIWIVGLKGLSYSVFF